ncbi:MAG: Fe-S cluster assembly protein SufD [Brevefilum sp.]|jgi:Fe-S cluster assembly protein SufD
MSEVSNTHNKGSRDLKSKELADFSFQRSQIPKVADAWLQNYRQEAWDAYEELPFPRLTDEAWRRTDIRDLQTKTFSLARQKHPTLPPSRYLSPIISGEEHGGQIISGAIDTTIRLDPSLKEKGIIFTDLCTAEREHPDLMQKILGQVIKPDEDKFSALAASLAEDGVFLYVPENVKVDQPLHSLYWGSGEGHAFINHIIVWVSEGAEITFVHESASFSEDNGHQIFHDGLVELYVERNAQLNFVELQSWGENVWSFTRERAKVYGDGRLEWVVGAMGTRLTKNFSDIDLMEPGATARMSGFYFTNDSQHFDLDTQQNHMAPNTTSDLLYKGALADQSRSVWQGMIYVAPGAIGTDGYQSNRNLILTKGARADSIPGLEILADDVRCTHGATVGKIDEDEIFYLLSRGIPRKEAEELIVTGFFDPIMARIPFEGIQKRFKEAIQEKMTDR